MLQVQKSFQEDDILQKTAIYYEPPLAMSGLYEMIDAPCKYFFL